MARPRRSVLEGCSRRETLKISRSNRDGMRAHHEAGRACRGPPRIASSVAARGDRSRRRLRRLGRSGARAASLPKKAGEIRLGGFLGHVCFLERSPLCRLKTSWPSLSKMRNPIVRGGIAIFAAATIAADASEA